MAIPVYLQQFKSAGIYRLVFDKSSVAGVDSETLRLVVGYSEKGPFNIPTYVKSVTDFKAIYGDISKKLEKRGIYFHRLALQCLEAGPILALNLKKFSTETVGAISLSPEFNVPETIQGTVDSISAKAIYDTTRFWEISADKLNSVSKLDKYVKMSAIGTAENSNSFFIRKASGSKVSSFNLTIKDWFASEGIPDTLERYANNKVSDFFAEVYVFGGEFKADQVLTSNSLKNYFDVDAKGELTLKSHVIDGLGRHADTLDALFADETANPLGHYVGCLIPNFKDKLGVYAALDILFNLDEEKHNMMMTFDSDAFENGEVDIDLSGRKGLEDNGVDIANVFAGTETSNVLLNGKALIVRDIITYDNLIAPKGVIADENKWDTTKLNTNAKLTGMMYVKEVVSNGVQPNDSYYTSQHWITVQQVNTATPNDTESLPIYFATKDELIKGAKALGVNFNENDEAIAYKGTYCPAGPVFNPDTYTFTGVDNCIDMVSRISRKSSSVNLYASFVSAAPQSVINCNNDDAIYGSSVSFLATTYANTKASYILDDCLASVVSVGDCILAADGPDDDNKFENQYVQAIEGNKVTFTGEIKLFENAGKKYVVRIDKPLNQEIGVMKPTFLKGYTFAGAKPAGTSMSAKIQWRNDYILSVLTDEVGVRTALLDKANIDYRYVVDTFESFVEASLKNVFCGLCKEKQSAFAILNFPAVKTFIKCPYSHYTDSNDVFNVQYIVDGLNKKKPGSVKFSLPTDFEGASFGAFYTPLKFSDGYVDTMVPSAGLVSNRFMEKYTSRKPYYIVAGPNYAKITYTDLVGPDYTYSREELNIIEPYGVNCMVYRPGFGTFINANQTAKQTPVTALSRVNVRELVIYLQDEVEKVLQAYQWEFNNPITRNAILARANSICANIAANGGIQAYLNVMDESNNTPDIIDNEMAILSTSIEPGFGCGKMVHELTIYGTGKLSAMITEQ